MKFWIDDVKPKSKKRNTFKNTKDILLDFIFRKFKVHPKIMCRICHHCCNYSDNFDCDYCKKMSRLAYWR